MTAKTIIFKPGTQNKGGAKEVFGRSGLKRIVVNKSKRREVGSVS